MSATGGGPYAFSPGYGITTIASTATSLISSNLLIRDGNDMGFNVASGSAGGRVDLLVSGNVSELYGVCGVIKTGGGVMVFAGSNTYTGNTLVNEGTLAVNGQLTASAISVNPTGVLSGTGTVGSSIHVLSGGTLSPGYAAGAGTLTAASLTLDSGSA